MSREQIDFTELFDFSRSTVATYTGDAGETITDYAIDEPRFIDGGLLVEYEATNLLINSATPATQTVTVTNGEAYTLTSFGTGAGYAFVSSGGSGTAPIGNPITFTASSTSVEISVSGSLEGFQLELGVESSSFIETAGASVTRESDLLSRALGSEYNSEEGTFFIEFIHSHQSAFGNNDILSSGSSSAFIRSTEANEYKAYNAAIIRDYPSIIPASGLEKIAFSFKIGELILARNGGSTTYITASGAILDVSVIKFFEAAEGVISKFQYWPEAKTESELEQLTAHPVIVSPRVDINATITDVQSDNIYASIEAGFSYDFSDNSRYFGTCTITQVEGVDLFGILLADNGYFRILLKHGADGAIPQNFFTEIVVQGVGTLTSSNATYTASLGTTGYDTSEWEWNVGINIAAAGWTDASSKTVDFIGVIESV